VDQLTQIAFEHEGESVVARLSGEIDLSNALEIKAALVVSAGSHVLVVDLSELSYLDSAGVRLLFEIAEQRRSVGKELRLVVPESTALKRVLLVAGLDGAVPLDPSVSAALASRGSR
jgi:stage II sporulation protein AA (anti-sigma F factor antagonist)